METLMSKCKKIKVVLTDVDGVLTDGGMYYSADGDIMKKFHVLDGMGVTMLRKNGIPTIIVTKEKNNIVKQWADKMKVKKLYSGIIEKELILKKICHEFNVEPREIAFLGDDINDVNLLKMVGLSAVPSDGVKEAKMASAYSCKKKGGQGCLREVAEMILRSKSIKIEYKVSRN